MAEMFRQGDLLFIKTSESPKGAKKANKIVLDSAVTGHDHSITKGEVYVANRSDFDRWERLVPNFYVVIPAGGADLTHPEHKTIPLSEGTYKVIRQREVNGYVVD